MTWSSTLATDTRGSARDPAASRETERGRESARGSATVPPLTRRLKNTGTSVAAGAGGTTETGARDRTRTNALTRANTTAAAATRATAAIAADTDQLRVVCVTVYSLVLHFILFSFFLFLCLGKPFSWNVKWRTGTYLQCKDWDKC